ncbi:MAG: hypothetical protein JWM32_1890 [Verrucomicrobia bacterium]|nr:hypothetical protein [Verrucomicrobiota bacterium]
MEFIDAHVHLLLPRRFRYDWCAGVPALDREFGLEDYRAAISSQPAGMEITGFVFMEADVAGGQAVEEAVFFAKQAGLIDRIPKLCAVIAGARPEAADFPADLTRLESVPHVPGVRRVLHTMPDDWCESPAVRSNLQHLAARRMTFDLCLRPHLLPAAARLAERCPETQFVLDHCGVPEVARGALDPWREDLRQLAARPNVACKFSGLAGCADPRRPLTPQVRPFFEHCLECFGASRLMWGSDWPVCSLEIPLSEWLATTTELLAGLTGEEQAAIARGTAKRAYRL